METAEPGGGDVSHCLHMCQCIDCDYQPITQEVWHVSAHLLKLVLLNVASLPKKRHFRTSHFYPVTGCWSATNRVLDGRLVFCWVSTAPWRHTNVHAETSPGVPSPADNCTAWCRQDTASIVKLCVCAAGAGGTLHARPTANASHQHHELHALFLKRSDTPLVLIRAWSTTHVMTHRHGVSQSRVFENTSRQTAEMQGSGSLWDCNIV